VDWISNHLRNKQGFTLIEALLALFIFMIISTLFTLILSHLIPNRNQQGIHAFEWENFIEQAKVEIREANEYHVDSNIIYFTLQNGTTSTFSKYKNLIRRQVDGTGHEVLVQQVSDFSCKEIANGIEVTVTDVNGKIHRRIITVIGRREVSHVGK
jgi:competence protein ComGF